MLDDIKRLATQYRIRFSWHALHLRMPQRGATRDDVRRALMTATSAVYQPDRDNYRVTGGTDTDGDDMDVVVAIEADLLIVTVF